MDAATTQAIIVRAANSLFSAFADAENARDIVNDMGGGLVLGADYQTAVTILTNLCATFASQSGLGATNRAILQKIRTT